MIDVRDYQIFITLEDISNQLQYAFKIGKAEFAAKNPDKMEQLAYEMGFQDATLEVYRIRIEALGIEKKGEEK